MILVKAIRQGAVAAAKQIELHQKYLQTKKSRVVFLGLYDECQLGQ